MKSTAIVLAMIGCLWQLPDFYRTYVWCCAGLPNGFTYPMGNEPHPIDATESYWRRQEASRRKDPSLWNGLPETQLAIIEFKAGATRSDLVSAGLVPEANPIRPLTSGEQGDMAKAIERWTFYNRGLEVDLLAMMVVGLVGFPWFLATLGCTVYWCFRRQFMAIVIAWTIPLVVMIMVKTAIRMMF